MAAKLIFSILAGLLFVQRINADIDVLTQRNDNASSGLNLQEKQINTGDVNKAMFGKLAFRIVDGNIYAQPLIVSGARIATRPGASTNVAIVATEHNSVYAFDAEVKSHVPTTAQLWHTGPDVLGAPIPYLEVDAKVGAPGCTDLTTENGITSTPVIYLTRQTPPKEGIIFVVAKSANGNQHFYKLFALRLADGAEISQVTIQGEVTGVGFGADANGKIRFNPALQLNRPALLLQNNILYIAFGGICDRPLGNPLNSAEPSYHGWLFAYDVTNPKAPKKLDMFCTTPNQKKEQYDGRGGIWMSGQGPAIDRAGNIYFVTGDGSNNGSSDLGNSLVKLRLINGKFELEGWYAPPDQELLKNVDVDLGSSGVVLVPNSRLLLIGSKEGKMYLIDRAQMHALDSFQVTHDPVFPPSPLAPGGFQYNIHGTPVVWPRHDRMFVYVNGEEDPLKQFELILDKVCWKFSSHNAFAISNETAPYFPFPQGMFGDPSRGLVWMPGGFISLSADASSDQQNKTAIVWVNMPYSDNANRMVVRGVLRAFDASRVSAPELWDSEHTGNSFDRLGQFAKFSVPTVANGKVYVGTFQAEMVDEAGVHTKRLGGDQPALVIYGLKPAR